MYYNVKIGKNNENMGYFNKIRKKILPKYIVLIAFAMLVPLIVGGIAIGINMQSAKNQSEKNRYLSLKALQTEMETRLSVVPSKTIELAMKPEIALKEYGKIDGYERSDLQDVIKNLNETMNANDFIGMMYIYMGSENKVLSGYGILSVQDFYNIAIEKTGESFDAWNTRMQKRNNSQYSFGDDVSYYNGAKAVPAIEYIQSYPFGKSVRGNVVVMVDAEKIKGNYGAMYDDSKALYILEKRGNVIFGMGNTGRFPLKEKHFDMEEGIVSPFFSRQVAVKAYGNNYSFISIESDTTANGGLKSLLLTDILLIFILVAASLILIFVAAYKTSEPVLKIKETLSEFDDSEDDTGIDIEEINKKIFAVFEGKKEAERIIEEQKISIKNSLLNRVIRGNCESIRGDLQRGDIFFDKSDYLVVIIDINSVDEGSENPLLLKYALQKMLFSAFEDFCNIECIDDEWGKLTAILNFENDTEMQTKIAKRLAEIEDFVSLEFLANAEINVGDVHKGIDNVWRSFREANECVEYRMYSGTGRVLFYNKLKNKQSNYLYDAEKENEIIRTVMMGNEKGALKCVRDMIDTHEDSSVAVMQCFFFNLIGTMLKILNLGNAELAKDIDHQMRLEKLTSCKNINELRQESEKIIHEMCASVNAYGGNKKKNLRNALLEYVERNFCDNSMCLEKVASEFGLNFNYVSHFFRDEIGESFSDLLTRLRVEKIKELLESDHTIAEIATRVGYVNSTVLIRNFKKVTGITPGKYRERL